MPILENINIEKYVDSALQGVLAYTPKIFGALIVLWVGFKIINIIGKIIEKGLKAKHIEPTVSAFLISLVKNILKALVFIAAVGILGVETSSFVAVFAATGLAIGLALSGTLSHFASGIMILIFKPYKVGDMIESAGHFGKVKEVQIFNTILETVDARTIIIPNSEAIGSSIINLSMVSKKRVDIDVGISYSDSIDRAREVMTQVAKANSMVLKDEPIIIGVKELGDNAVIFTFRTWVNTADYWTAFFALTEEVKKAFDATNGELNFPFPQRDVHMYNAK